MRGLTLLLVVFLSVLAAAFPTLNGQKIPKPELLHFPITKHELDYTYHTSLNIGSSPKSPIKLILDLGTNLTWLNCRKIKSLSSLRVVTCKSSACKSIPGTSCLKNSCLYKQFSPFDQFPVAGRVVQDKISFQSTVVPRFTFVCAGQKKLGFLSTPVDGVLGLSPESTSFWSQVTSAFNVIPKFVLCLPSSTSGSGHLYVGAGPSFPRTLTVLSRTTPRGYSVSVRSIYIDGMPLPLKSGLLNNGAILTTSFPFTLLPTDIYTALAKSFTQKAKAMGISKVAPVKQLKDCFDSRTIKRNSTGPNVPVIEIGLPGNGREVTWRFYGATTMVKVSEKVMCLAFVDAGKTFEQMYIGSYQMQDYMLEFDLSTGRLGFSESLLLQNSTCSTWRPQN